MEILLASLGVVVAYLFGSLRILKQYEISRCPGRGRSQLPQELAGSFGWHFSMVVIF